MSNNKAELIVALDVPEFKQAKRLVDRLSGDVKTFKVGSQLFTACGHRIIEYIGKKGGRVFLDLKFHDIPNTVARAVEAACGLGVYMLTVHASGGREMLEAAKVSAARAAGRLKKKRPMIVAVTVLTSSNPKGAAGRVFALAKLAKASGVDGIVASALECGRLRKRFRRNFIIVTPGIRPWGSGNDDQKRVATAEAAVRSGSNFLVVGRPIVAAEDPKKAARQILIEMKA